MNKKLCIRALLPGKVGTALSAAAAVLLTSTGMLATRPAVAATCPFDTSSAVPAASVRAELLAVDPVALDDDCFGMLIARLASGRRRSGADSIFALVEKRVARNRFGDAALLSLARHPSTKSYQTLWLRIVRLWEKNNGRAYQYLAGLTQGGSIRLADSLYEALDADSVFDVHDLMRWAGTKHVLDRPLDAARLYCRICNLEPRLTPIALSQLSHQTDDMQQERIVATLDSFTRCYLSTSAADTVAARNFLADTYARLDMFDKEIEVLTSLETHSSPVTRQLIEVARDRFIRNDYRHVITPARLAYSRLPKGDLRSLAATLLYQAYLERGQHDSALVWLGRSDLNTHSRTVDAVVLYQLAGQFRKSGSLIDSLDEGMCRDTLTMRQLIYSGEPGKAADYASALGSSWKRGTPEAALWAARTLLFDRRLDKLGSVLDSAGFPPAWPGAPEMLRYRYWMHYLGASEAALDLWAAIEYDLYTGKPEQAGEKLKTGRVRGGHAAQLRLRVATALIDKGNPVAALDLLTQADTVSATPEFEYMRADALLRTGKVDEARGILEKLVLEHPGDIFSSKARMLLSRMRPAS